jgi:YggT family protein
MLVLGNVLLGFGEVLWGILWLYQWILVARMIISWVSADPRNPIVSFIHAVTDPPMRLIRRRLPTTLRYFPLDIAFLVLFALVILARYGIAQSLIDYAAILRSRGM